jgi:hypothetical protein
MGAGILPTTIHKNKVYFLFGKENKYEDSAEGFSDFGGGTDNNEDYLQTAVREGGEELTGFLGNENDVKKMLQKHGTYNIDYKSEGFNNYRMHIFPIKYDHLLPFYYNNNQQFLQNHLDPKIIQKSKLFEKEEIRWVCIDDIIKMRPKFRSYFQNIINIIHNEKKNIRKFIIAGLKNKTYKKKSTKNKTLKRFNLDLKYKI